MKPCYLTPGCIRGENHRGECKTRIQVPACDACSQGVMDLQNVHRQGMCECGCHKEAVSR